MGLLDLFRKPKQSTAAPAPKAPPKRESRAQFDIDPSRRVHVIQDPEMEDLEVEGESYRREAFKTLFLRAGRASGGVISRTALLVPEPKNQYDRNAVAIIVDDLHVGYLAREYAQALSRPTRESIAEGIQPAVPARIWAVPDGGTWRARVTLEFTGASGEDRDFAREEAENRERIALQDRARDVSMVRSKPFTWWRGDVNNLKRAEKYEQALKLLHECIEAAEKEAGVMGGPPQQWPTEQAAIVYRKVKDASGEVAVIRRYEEACPPGEFPDKIAERLHKAERLLNREQPTAGSISE
ncbi:hypothetical protein FHE66_02730 [Georgenia sp. 311]|uniref:HIRAN domain-containing protein n=1 Tax=Georgenia sp. 311 TaxID=2585134 RepID=UPI0011126FB7|nr:HIRAN domain-containing protein [Georgenia sp. 311]TNC19777.1 hypothetical protein FHE66_02730 [Georgenia sp. 311]